MPYQRASQYPNASTMLPGASGSCGKCGIEAPGGVQLVYWQPDAIRNQSVVTAPANEPYTIVENGFTFTSPSVYGWYFLEPFLLCWASILRCHIHTLGPSVMNIVSQFVPAADLICDSGV